MIYIWDNGGEYSDHEIALIRSEAPWFDVSKFLRGGSLIASADQLQWYEGQPSTLAEHEGGDRLRAFFRHPEVSVDVEWPGSYTPVWHDALIRQEKKMWELSKHKGPWFDAERGLSFYANPGPLFDLLTPLLASEFLRDGLAAHADRERRMDEVFAGRESEFSEARHREFHRRSAIAQFAAFEFECHERGLL